MGIVRGEVAGATAASQFSTQADDATVIAARDGGIVIDDPVLLTQGEYLRLGPDLMIVGPDGAKVLLTDYFAMANPPDLAGPGAMTIAADLASALAGPRAPGQVAQAGEQLAQAAKSIGTVTRLDGEVFATRADGTRVRLQSGDEVFQGDVLETGEAGAVGITFVDGTEMSLGADGRMVLDEMIYDPEGGDGSSQFSLVSGVFSFVSGEIAKTGPDAMQVTTPVATIGIRGTKGVIKVHAIDTDGDGEADAQMEVALLDSGEIVVSTFQGGTQVINQAFTGFRVVQISGRDVLTGPSQEETETFRVTREYFDNEGVGTALRFLPSQNQNEPPPEQGQAPDQLEPNLDPDGPTLNQDLTGHFIKVVLNPQDIRQLIGLPPIPVGDPDPVSPVVVNPDGDTGGSTASGGGEDMDQGTGTGDGAGDEGTVVVGDPVETVTVNGTFDAAGSTKSFRVFGGSGSDTVFLGSGGDVVYGGGGDDHIQTNAGDDIVYGGGGADTVVGGSGEGFDAYHGGDPDGSDDSADDMLIYTSATRGVYVDLALGFATGVDIDHDTLSGFEHVQAAGGEDVLKGNAAANRLESGGGNDLLIGAGGDDALKGGMGDDVYAYIGNSSGWGHDVIDDAGGNDVLDLTQAAGHEPSALYLADADGDGAADDLVVDYTGGSSQVVLNHTGAGRMETIRVVDEADGSTDDYAIRDAGGATGGNDVLFGDAGANTLDGGSGDDALFGNDGDDTYVLAGSFGRDFVSDFQGSNVIYMSGAAALVGVTVTSEGNTLLSYADASELEVAGTFASYTEGAIVWSVGSVADGYVGTSAADFIIGTNAADTINGADGKDIIAGGGGNDILEGGAGDDTLFGGDGSDVYVYESSPFGGDLISDSGGSLDRIAVSDLPVYDVSRSGDDLILNFGNAGGIVVRDHFAGGRVETLAETLGGVTRLYRLQDTTAGGETADLIVADGAGQALHGSGGDDLLFGGDGDDTLTGGAGDDTIVGGGGDDLILYEGAGDTIDGGLGTNTLKFTGATAVIDAAALVNVSNISALMLDDGGAMTAMLTTDGYDALVGQSGALYVRSDGDDTLLSDAAWTQGVTVTDGGVDYQVWTLAGRTVMVEAGTNAILNPAALLGPTWIGGADANFETDGNWLSTDGTMVSPSGAGIAAYIDAADVLYGSGGAATTLGTVYLTTDASLTVVGGTLAVDTIMGSESMQFGGVRTGDLHLAAGTLDIMDADVDTFAMTGGMLNISYDLGAQTFAISGGTINGAITGYTADNSITGAVVNNGTVHAHGAGAATTINAADITGTGSLSVLNGVLDISDSTIVQESLWLSADGGQPIMALHAVGADTSVTVNQDFQVGDMTMSAAAGRAVTVTSHDAYGKIDRLDTTDETGTGALTLSVTAGAAMDIAAADIATDLTLNINGAVVAYDQSMENASVTWNIDGVLSLTGSGTFGVDGDASFGSESGSGVVSVGSDVTLRLMGDYFGDNVFDLRDFRVFDGLSRMEFDSASDLVVTMGGIDDATGASVDKLYVRGGAGDTVHLTDDPDTIDPFAEGSAGWSRAATLDETVENVSYQAYVNDGNSDVLMVQTGVTVTDAPVLG